MEYEVSSSFFLKDLDENNFLLESEEESMGDGFVFKNLFKEYEQVVVKSLITSFGLDGLLIHDRRGGNVDTINTVRDNSIKDYANKENQEAYRNKKSYDSNAYHNHKNYKMKNKEFSQQKKSGNLEDAYTGKKTKRNANIDLDHIISAKEIDDDPGRLLAGLEGKELANMDTNLVATDRSINRSKKASTVTEFNEKLEADKSNRQAKIKDLERKKNLTDREQKELKKLKKLDEVNPEKMQKKDDQAREAYEKKVATTYYTSKKFLKNTATSSLKMGYKLGLRQCLGLILTEVWISVSEKLPEIMSEMKEAFDLGSFLKAVGKAFKKAFTRIKEKYKELIKSFKDGMLAGILASLTSTIINIFFTSAKFIQRILRESWASLIEAINILAFNPDHLPFGEVIRSVAKIIAVCISVVCGGMIQEALTKMITIPLINDLVGIFVGSMVTGIMSISMLYFFDHSDAVKKIVDFVNDKRSEFDIKLDYYKELKNELVEYTAKLTSIDMNILKAEVARIANINSILDGAKSERELNGALHTIIRAMDIEMPYQNLKELDNFMASKDTILII